MNATIGCSKGVFEQIYYNFNVGGSVPSGTYVPVQPPGEFWRRAFCMNDGKTDGVGSGCVVLPGDGDPVFAEEYVE